MKTYWLSFCDLNKPKGQQFLGACIIKSFSEERAIQIAWDTGCNPGGQVMIVEATHLEDIINPDWLYRLMNKQEAESDIFLLRKK